MMENEILQKILNELQVMNGRLDRLEADVSVIKEDIAEIKEDIADLKEHTVITRDATNDLLRWVDQASPTVHVKFPYRKKSAQD